MSIEFKCEDCGQPLSIDEEHSGKEANCPKCGRTLTIPTIGQTGAGQTVQQGGTKMAGEKSKTTALVLSILLGGIGVDRFYLGLIGSGILKLVTGGGLGIWYIIDIILIATGKLKGKKG